MTRFGSIENLPRGTTSELDTDYRVVRDLFLNPRVSETYSIAIGVLDEEGLIHFLCDERDFARETIDNAIKTFRSGISMKKSKQLRQYLS